MVTIYTVPGCPKCRALKKRATDLGVEFVESQDANKVIEAGFRSAPILEKDGKFYPYTDAFELLKHIGA